MLEQFIHNNSQCTAMTSFVHMYACFYKILDWNAWNNVLECLLSLCLTWTWHPFYRCSPIISVITMIDWSNDGTGDKNQASRALCVLSLIHGARSIGNVTSRGELKRIWRGLKDFHESDETCSLDEGLSDLLSETRESATEPFVLGGFDIVLVREPKMAKF